jgi:exo-beta-1,3-glucanase (GH17 family)
MSSRKFGLNLVVVLAIAALFTGFWALINRPVTPPPTGLEQISGFSYSPFQQGQYPQKDQYPTDDEMRRDLEIMSKLTDNIRTYSVDGLWGHPQAGGRVRPACDPRDLDQP